MTGRLLTAPGSGFAATDSDRFAECGRRGLETVTDLDEFTRCKVDALLLYIRTRPLTSSILEQALQLLLQVLDDVGEVGHLRGDESYVRVIRHPVLCGSLGESELQPTRERPGDLT